MRIQFAFIILIFGFIWPNCLSAQTPKAKPTAAPKIRVPVKEEVTEMTEEETKPEAAVGGEENAMAPESENEEPVIFIGDSPEKKKAEEEAKKKFEEAQLEKRDINLFYDPILNGVSLARQAIDYDLTNPYILRIGPYELKAGSINMMMTREMAEFTEIDFGIEVRKRKTFMYLVSFRWPLDYVQTGVMELIDDHNRVYWQHKVDELALQGWRETLDKRKPVILKSHPTAVGQSGSEQVAMTLNPLTKTNPHSKSHFGLLGRSFFEIPIWQIKKPFRFCLTQDSEEGRLALCSKRYLFYRKGGRFYLKEQSTKVRARVQVNEEAVTLKGSAIFLDNASQIKFSALLGNGSYFEFVAKPKPVNIVDMTLDEANNKVDVVGFGNPPLGQVEMLDFGSKDFWSFMNFMPTIGDFRQFWRTSFSTADPALYLKGFGGAPFKQSFVYDHMPSKRARLTVSKDSPKSTYKSTVELKGRTAPDVAVSSKQVSAEKISAADFNWNFLADKRGQINRSEIFVKEGEHTYTAFHEIYRGYPGEVALRVSGVLTNDLEMVVLAEGAIQHWFEKLLGWESQTYSLQRWGVAAKYFQAVASFAGKSDKQSLLRLQVINADLKYRLTPGVWGRDPSLGLSVNAQTVDFLGYKAAMAGGGVFWARSMPRIFDDFFNLIPFMRYPKWVDMEVLLFALPLDANNQLGINMALNFHGKIQWREQLYGEAGFGVKSFQFNDLSARQQIGVGMAYGTLGLGYNF